MTFLKEMPYSYGRHQTFTIRYTWLPSAYQAVVREPDLFSNHPHRVLGVGKNMARSIKFWLEAAGLVNNDRNVLTPTPFGEALLGRRTSSEDSTLIGGADPYLEADASWWLLHWKLLGPDSLVPAWWTAFHLYPSVTFESSALTKFVNEKVTAEGRDVPDNTLHRDILALIRNYSGETDSGREKVDDRIDVPFARLAVVRPAADGHYRFLVGPKPGLEPEVALFAALEFLNASGQLSNQTTIGSLAFEAGGPGRAFKVYERDLIDLFKNVPSNRLDGKVAVTTLNGAEQLVTEGTHDDLAFAALDSLYRRTTGTPVTNRTGALIDNAAGLPLELDDE